MALNKTKLRMSRVATVGSTAAILPLRLMFSMI
jgi:hypothetical protein